MIKLWQLDQLSAMVAPYKVKDPLKPAHSGSPQSAVETATRTVPKMANAANCLPERRQGIVEIRTCAGRY